MLKVQHVNKKYPGEHNGAVVDLTFQLGESEILTIVGKSGSGKSTLLRMTAGLMKPDAGNILFNGVELENPDEQLIPGHGKIKMVFQDFQVKPNMTVSENIKYKLLHFNNDFQEERSAELLALCGLTDFRDKKPNELSGGQKQRLSLARALADDPQLLLMDEPFSNLDPVIKEELLMEITEIVRKEEVGLILVSHDVRDAMLISDRIAYIQDGRLIQIDTPYEIYKRPNSLSIANFFGRMNDISKLLGQPGSYIRAEDIQIDGGGKSLEAKVLACKFLGERYLISSSVNNSNSIVFYSPNEISPNSIIKVSFENSFVLQFS